MKDNTKYLDSIKCKNCPDTEMWADYLAVTVKRTIQKNRKIKELESCIESWKKDEQLNIDYIKSLEAALHEARTALSAISLRKDLVGKDAREALTKIKGMLDD